MDSNTRPVPLISEQGIFDLTAEQYHGPEPCPEPSLSSSGARKLVVDPPAKFWFERNNPTPPTKALIVGSAAHEWLLEGEKWPQRHVVLDPEHNARTNAGKAVLAEAIERGMRCVTADEFATIKAMKAQIEAHPYAMAAFQNGRAETSMFWVDEHTGIWCRARPDFLPATGRIFADYKTTVSCRTDDLKRTIGKYGYHMQASWYSDGLRALGLCDDPIMLFVFQEKTPPYLVRCVTVGAPSLIAAEGRNYQARSIFARCVREDRWPGYDEDIQTLDIMPWELTKAENELADQIEIRDIAA
jgi:hypothetical protein